LLGMDAFLAFTTWQRWRDILQLAHIVVACRPGSEASASGTAGELLENCGTGDRSDLLVESSGKIHVHAVSQLDIASSAIRDMVERGASPKFLVPETVERIINESGCYKSGIDKGGAN
jgi:nicotinate-nucleotide adenylyltransferase